MKQEMTEQFEAARNALWEAQKAAQDALTAYQQEVELRYFALLSTDDDTQRAWLANVGPQFEFDGIWTSGVSLDSFQNRRDEIRKAEQLVARLEQLVGN